VSTHSNRLYDHFQHERSAFGRYVLAVVSLGVFFALIFEPYLRTLASLADLDRQLTTQAVEIAAVQREVSAATRGIERATELMGDASAYVYLYVDMQSWMKQLGEIEQLYDRQSRRLSSLYGALSREDQEAWQRGTRPAPRILRALRAARTEIDFSDDCFFRLEDDLVKCLVDRELAPVHDRLAEVLYDRGESHRYTARLNEAVEANRKRYQQGFSAAVGGADIAGWVREYVDTEIAIIRDWHEELADELMGLLQDATQQRTLLTQNEAQRASLASRKEEISSAGRLDTPVGPLPLAFHDILALLPLIMLATASMLVRSHLQLLILRRNFRLHGPDEETQPQALRLTMPMWLDPLAGHAVSLLVLSLLMLPGIAAIVGLLQLVSSPGLAFSFAESTFTFVATLAAAVVFAAYYAKLVIMWRGQR